MIEAKGYMIDATYDGQTLTVQGTNKMGQRALTGWTVEGITKENGKAGVEVTAHEGAVVVDRADIVGIDFKDASMVVNGNLTIHRADGKKLQLHFRKKQTKEFATLRDAIQQSA